MGRRGQRPGRPRRAGDTVGIVSENGQPAAAGRSRLGAMDLDADRCYAAIRARDARFDGVFFVGVTTTRIYCRPVCTVRTPGHDRCRYYANAASAEAAGFRPCLRCRPELAPGHAAVDAVRNAARWAVARIESGALEDRGLEALAADFGISSRQLRRVVEREYGVTPVELAQTRRLLFAKQLVTDTALPMADVAFASGFSSVRRFNHLFRTRYRLQPSALRRQQAPAADAGIVLKLAYRPPLEWSALAGFLASRGATGVDAFDGARYLRSVRLGAQRGWVAVAPMGKAQLRVELSPSLLPVLTQLLPRLRRLFDLDANPVVIASHLGRDPRLAKLVAARPGLRVPGTLDGFELALRAVLGQQVSVKAATTLFRRFVERFGEPIATPFEALTRLTPRAEDVAEASPRQLITLGLTRARAATVHHLARAVAEGTLKLEPSADSAAVVAAMQELPGIGPWTAQYVAMRALADPDAMPHADLGLLRALGVRRGAELEQAAQRWRPYRAYAALQLWHGGSGG
jgi:AraC family transcriptional regulator of adaptative response / DNA-3-methyladenine glycosylase II